MIVSIVVCTRDRAERLRESLKSFENLAGPHLWELIVVDNGSASSTSEIITEAARRNPRIVPAREDRIGLGHARNAGWQAARGDIICFTDDDCYPAPDYVAKIVEVFAEDPGLGFVGGRILLFDPRDIALTIDFRETACRISPQTFIPAGELQGANLALRREVLAALGGFDRRFGAGTRYPCEDIDLVAAALWAGVRGGYDPRPTIFHHHGRRQADYERTMAGYDQGRGAYYMKYVMRRASRMTYLKGWRERTLPLSDRKKLEILLRELASARAFVKDHGLGTRLVYLPLIEAVRIIVALRLRHAGRE